VIVLDDDDIENLTGKSVGNNSKNSKNRKKWLRQYCNN
jgi:hypothetical protein